MKTRWKGRTKEFTMKWEGEGEQKEEREREEEEVTA